MGDGGLNYENPLMDLYILAQSGKKMPRVCFLGTASGDDSNYTKYFKYVFGNYPCTTHDLALFHPHTANIEEFIMSMDVIYVGGGHSKSMLGVWREWGVDKILRGAYENGTVLAGGSAGSVCWFRECITDSFPGGLSVMPCLDFLPYSHCPHYASEKRRSVYNSNIAAGKISAGYAADDYTALHFIDGNLVRCVSSVEDAHCYNLYRSNDNKPIQTRLNTKYLNIERYKNEFIFNSPCFDYLKDLKLIDDPELDSGMQ